MLEKIVDAAIRLGIPLSLVAEASGYTQAPVPVTNRKVYIYTKEGKQLINRLK